MTGSLSLTLQWMLATARALTLAAVVMEILVASTVGSLTLPIHLLAAAAVGLPVGAAQWIILRRLVPDPGYWIPVTGAAPVDRLLTWIAGRPSTSSMEAILPGGLLAGGITGAVLPLIFDVPERPHRPDETRAP